MAPSSFSAGSKKRSLEMVVYDPAAAAAAANKRARDDDEETSTSSASTSPAATALFLLAASAAAAPPFGDLEPISAVPISAVPPHPWPRSRPRPPVGGREEPPCLRKHFLVALGLRADLPLHFVADKCVTNTDLEPHQNRFRIPREGVDGGLRPILSLQELYAANLLEDDDPTPPVPRKKKRPRQQEEQPGPSEPPQNGAAEGQGEQLPPGKKVKKPKKKGKVHGGLRVKLVDLDAGAKELLMARWMSSQGTVVKGEGYLKFVRQCRFKERDKVEIWAFVQRRFRLFGADVCDDSLLHLLVVKKQEKQEVPRCCYCRAQVPPPSRRLLPPPGS